MSKAFYLFYIPFLCELKFYLKIFLQVEEAKLITQLADIDAINFGLFKQAYNASLDVSKVLDQYEMSKILKGPYDMEGASVTIKAGSEGYPEVLII